MSQFDSRIYERDIYQDTVYSAWLRKSNERNVLEQVLRDYVGWWCKEGLSILDIGCGTGSAAQRVFTILREKGFSYTYTGVDPYEDQLQRFRDASPGQSNLRFICSQIEQFTPEKRFDFAMVVHSLYYVDSFEDVLTKVVAGADKVVIVHHGKFGINEVHQQFRSYVKSGPHIISTWEDVQRSLENVGIPYRMEIRDTEVDVSACKNPLDEDGEKLIKFFLEHSELPEKHIEKVREWFRARPDIMRQDVGYFFIG